MQDNNVVEPMYNSGRFVEAGQYVINPEKLIYVSVNSGGCVAYFVNGEELALFRDETIALVSHLLGLDDDGDEDGDAD